MCCLSNLPSLNSFYICTFFQCSADRPFVPNPDVIASMKENGCSFFTIAPNSTIGKLVMHLSISSPGYPPRETMGEMTASLHPGVWNLTTRWVTGVGHIDQCQFAL